MGKILLVAVILFAAYWGWKYYTASNKKEEPKPKPKFYTETDDIDELVAFYERKIDEIESKSVEEIEKASEKLNEYKAKLEKIKNLKK